MISSQVAANDHLSVIYLPTKFLVFMHCIPVTLLSRKFISSCLLFYKDKSLGYRQFPVLNFSSSLHKNRSWCSCLTYLQSKKSKSHDSPLFASPNFPFVWKSKFSLCLQVQIFQDLFHSNKLFRYFPWPVNPSFLVVRIISYIHLSTMWRKEETFTYWKLETIPQAP